MNYGVVHFKRSGKKFFTFYKWNNNNNVITNTGHSVSISNAIALFSFILL